MRAATSITDSDVLLVIDVQNDFCPGGALPVERGHHVVPAINRHAMLFRHIVLTQDWHPPGHLSFASSHSGRQPYETITAAYGPQILWPDHCVQGTSGAAFHAELDIPQAQLIIRKGFRREIDSYSAFYENDHKTPTGLAGYLRERGFTRVFVTGLALDFVSAIPQRMRARPASTWWWSRKAAAASTSTIQWRQPSSRSPRRIFC